MAMAKKILEEITKEVLNRYSDGVFAFLYEDRTIYPTWKASGGWTNVLGLASRIQSETLTNVSGVSPMSRADLTPSNAIVEVDPDQELSAVPTDQLISWLYQQRGQWVLGLRRDRTVEGKTPWEGVLWNGSGITCSGLSALLQRCICDQVAENFDEHCGHDPIRPLRRRVREVLTMEATSDDDPLAIGGIHTYLTYEASRLRERTDGVGKSLKEFIEGAPLNPDPPITPRQPADET